MGNPRFCRSCGTALGADAQFCASCGAATVGPPPAESLPPPPTTPRTTDPGPAAATQIRLGPGEVVAGLPIELWLVIGLYALAGGALVIQALRALPDTFDVIELLPRLGFALLLLLVAIGALGAGLLLVAWRLHQADRVGRGLAYVAAAMVFTSVAFSDNPSTSAIIALLASIAAAAVLGLSPNVRTHFTGPNAPHWDEPTSIVVARTCVIVLAVLLAIVSLAFLLLGSDEGRYIVVALGLIGVAIGGFLVSQRLPAADRQARVILTVGAGIAFVLILLGLHDGGSVMLLGLVAAVPVALWVPPDARTFFGDPPLQLGAGGGAR